MVMARPFRWRPVARKLPCLWARGRPEEEHRRPGFAVPEVVAVADAAVAAAAVAGEGPAADVHYLQHGSR